MYEITEPFCVQFAAANNPLKVIFFRKIKDVLQITH